MWRLEKIIYSYLGGAYDRKQLLNDSSLHIMCGDWVYKHVDLKTLYANKKGVKKMGMVNALSMEGIDDARNIAKIFIKNFSLLGL